MQRDPTKIQSNESLRTAPARRRHLDLGLNPPVTTTDDMRSTWVHRIPKKLGSHSPTAKVVKRKQKMSTAPGNIFLTTENLAFSLPLIAVCSTYAYFKFVPLEIGLPILGVLFVAYQISAQMKQQRDNKLQNMDDKAMDDLALELEGESDTGAEDAAKAEKLAKKKAAIQRRVEAEKRKEAKKANSNKKKGGDDDEDDLAFENFAKGSRAAKKKN